MADIRTASCKRPLAIAMLILLGAATPGCSLFYKHRVARDGYEFYCDRSPAELETTLEYIDRCVGALSRRFGTPEGQTPRPAVFYEEHPLRQQNVFVQEAPEGYYLPMFRMVHVSPREIPQAVARAEAQAGAPSLPAVYSTDAVILHELCHHYLIAKHPQLNSRSWLNEGLACLLELGYWESETRLELPLFHPWLHEQARLALRELGAPKLEQEVARLAEIGWFGFHRQQERTRNYALSTVMVRVLLRGLQGNLESRIEQLVALDTDEIRLRLRHRVPMELRATVDQHLYRIWEEGRHRSWALDQWVEWAIAQRRHTDPRWVATVASLLPTTSRILPAVESDLPEVGLTPASARVEAGAPVAGGKLREPLDDNTVGMVAAARLLTHAHLTGGQSAELTDRLHRTLTAGHAQTQFLQALGTPGYDGRLYRPVIDLLEHREPDVRLAAAQALARWHHTKPTITRPEFWTSDSNPARDQEVEEWRAWIAQELQTADEWLLDQE